MSGTDTQKDKDTGGTMRERINRLARGIIDSETPKLVLKPERLEAVVQAGEVIRGEIVVSSVNNLHIKGLAYSSHERVQVVNSAFGGLRNRIVYEVNSKFSEHGDIIEGSFYLITNGGEREIPYSLQVQTGNSGEVLGQLKTPRDFGNLARREFNTALRMFEYQDFTEAPFMQDARIRTIYEGLKGRIGRRNLLEEFLVALQVKEPVELTVDTRSRAYEKLVTDVEDSIDIIASGWGYVAVEIQTDAPFIELKSKEMTDREFVNSKSCVIYRILPKQLHRGRNFGRIKLRSLRQEFTIEIEAEGESTAMDMGTDADKQIDRRSLVNCLSLRLDYETGALEPSLLVTQMMKEVERLRAGYPEDQWIRVIQADLLLLGGRKENAAMCLDEARDAVLSHREEQPERYCFYQYLRLQLTDGGGEQKESLCRYIRTLLWKDGQRNQPSLLLLLMKLDDTMALNPLDSYNSLKKLFQNGSSSPFMYAAAARLTEEHPELLSHLGDFEIQHLYLGIRKGITSLRVALKAAKLALEVKYYRRLLERLMIRFYEAYPEKELLEAVCSILIKGERKNKGAFLWYEKALKAGVNLTRLYEYFLYALPKDYAHLLPQEVLLYFSYDKDLDSRSRSVLYRNILLYMNPSSKLYQSYTRSMELFAMEQLFKNRINSRMAVIYEHMIYKDMIDEPVARVLPGILKAFRIRCGDPRMKYVIIRYVELEAEEAYLLEDQAAYVPLFSDQIVILFQDSYGNRYLNVKHIKMPVMDKPDLLKQCYQVYPDHPMLKLEECRRIVSRGVENDRQAELLEETMLHMRLNSVFERQLIQSVTDYYCREAAEDRDGMGAFSCTYLVQLDKKALSARQRQQICETLISQNHMQEAYHMIQDYGSQYIQPARLMKLCARMILQRLFDQDDLLLYIAYRVFRAGIYDSVILDYLCEHFNGTVSQMYEVLIQGVKDHVETYDLEERLLGQMLFTGCCQQMDSVFDLYIKRKPARESVVKAYFTQKSIQYFLERQDVDDRVFDYLKQALGGNSWRDDMPTIYTLALTLYFSTRDKLNEEDRQLCKNMTGILLDEGLVFPYTRDLSKHIPIPEDIMDKAMVEYRGRKDRQPELQMKIEPEEDTWHSEDLRRIYQGIYVKQTVLFQGETMEYRIYDGPEGSRTLAAEGIVECDHKLEGKENSRFAFLNEMGAVIKNRDDKRLAAAMEEYLKKSAVLGALFPIE